MGPLEYFIVLVLVAQIGVIDAYSKVPYFRRDYQFLNTTGAYYKYHSEYVKWEEAKAACEAESAVLYFPETELEVDAVKNIHRDRMEHWLGARREDGSIRQTVDGQMISDLYHNWARGEPNNVFGVENCVTMKENGEINDYHCNALLSFVCKKTLLSLTSGMEAISEPKYDDDKTQKLVGRRDFYEFHRQPKTWEEARYICGNVSSTLFYPEDQADLGRVTDLTNGTYWQDWIWLGASQVGYTDEFITVNDKTFSETYHNWYPVEPKIINRRKNCVTLCRDGTYKSRDCTDRHPFVCKTTVFVSAIAPEKGLPTFGPTGEIVSSIPSISNQSPFVNDLIQSITHDPLPENCLQDSECKGTCRTINRKSKSHVYFGNVIADELQKFPGAKKLQAMHAIMKVMREQWTEAASQCALP